MHILNSEKKVFFIPIGGSEEIGMNANVYCHKDECIIVDLGISFTQKAGCSVLLPDIECIKQIIKNKKCHGILLTHAHEDHIGALQYLYKSLTNEDGEELPLYATKFTAEIIKSKVKSKIQKKLNIVKCRETYTAGSFSFKWVHITHSIPDSNAIFIQVNNKKILHTGDWKIDKNPTLGECTDIDTFKEIGKNNLDALVCDSTNIFEPGCSGSEEDVYKNLLEEVKKHKNKEKILITCFSSNVARVETCRKIAEATNRKFYALGRSMENINKIASACFKQEKIKKYKECNEKKIIVCTGSQGEEKAVLAKIAANKHCIKLSNKDCLIFSSRIINGNEKKIYNLHNIFARKNIEVINKDEMHVSGHANQEELKELYSWVRPSCVIPVHGESRHIKKHYTFAKENNIHSVQTYNGCIIEINKEQTNILKESYKISHKILDGNNILPLNCRTIQERETIYKNGCLFISLNKKENKITFLGVRENKFKGKIQKCIKNHYENNKTNIIQKIQNIFREEGEKYPFVVIHE